MKHHVPSAHALCPTPLGELLLAASPDGLCGAWFTSEQKSCPDRTGWGPPQPGHPRLAEAARQLDEYFGGQRTRFELPLDLSAGTDFQQAVWRALLGIEAGHSQSYGQLAARIGRAAAVRAVGAAVGANPISIVLPCHRVLGSSGVLTGYAGGLARKAALLRLEGWTIGAAAEDDTPSATARPRRRAAA